MPPSPSHFQEDWIKPSMCARYSHSSAVPSWASDGLLLSWLVLGVCTSFRCIKNGKNAKLRNCTNLQCLFPHMTSADSLGSTVVVILPAGGFRGSRMGSDNRSFSPLSRPHRHQRWQPDIVKVISLNFFEILTLIIGFYISEALLPHCYIFHRSTLSVRSPRLYLKYSNNMANALNWLQLFPVTKPFNVIPVQLFVNFYFGLLKLPVFTFKN